MKQTKRINIYQHEIELKRLKLKNCAKDEFRQKLEKIPYRGYHVEDISDGRQIVITKPGGKRTYGQIRREDFMVWIHNPKDKTLWLISHQDIGDDLNKKGQKDPSETIRIIEALEKVFNGEEPDEVLKSYVPPLSNPIGELPEVLLKAYKWIWGQEDCNYPNGEGRDKSMKEIIKEIKEVLVKQVKKRKE